MVFLIWAIQGLNFLGQEGSHPKLSKETVWAELSITRNGVSTSLMQGSRYFRSSIQTTPRCSSTSLERLSFPLLVCFASKQHGVKLEKNLIFLKNDKNSKIAELV